MARPALTARGQWLRIALAVPPLIGLFFLGQAILDRRAWRLDLTPERRYTLSERARSVLETLDTDVRVLAFLRAQDPRNLLIRDLLRQLQAYGPRVRVDVVDVNRSPALAREYGVSSYGALVVESDGRRRVFSNPREEMLIAAILQVTRQQRKTLAWIVGHGEGDPNSSDRTRGYASARAFLENEYYEVVPVSLLSDDVPVGTAVVLIVGPTKDFLPEELDALDRYLDRPGNAMIMLDPLRAPRLAERLQRFAIELPPEVVVDPGARLYGGEYSTIQVQAVRPPHPILAPVTAPALFSLPRSIQLPSHLPAGIAIQALLETGPESWATRDTTVLRTGSAAFVPGRDRRGPIPVGVEIAFAVTAVGAPPAQGRLVVLGNADFANNFFIEYLGNKDLFVNAVAWLARDPEALGRRAARHAPGVNQFFVSAEAADRLFWLVACVQPALFGLAALGLALRRWWS